MLRDATDFDWDQMYVFGPYTPDYEVERRLGRSWLPAHSVNMENNDGVVLLVFLKGISPVAYVAQSRDLGDFATVDQRRTYTPETAEFRARLRTSWTEIVNVASDDARAP